MMSVSEARDDTARLEGRIFSWPPVVILFRLVAWLAALPYVAVVLLVMTGPPTWSAVAYLAGMGVLLWGLMTFPGRAGKKVLGAPALTGRPRGLTRGAALSVLAVAIVRGCTARPGETLAFEPVPRFVDRIVDEQDVAVAGTRVLVATGMLRDDATELPSAMRAAYARMHASEGDSPSPVLATYLGMQAPSEFDLLVVLPESEPRPREALVFLHGFAGNFALPCWQAARAVAPLGVMTVCPSMRWTGDWWSAAGEATLRRTLDALHARGVSRVVLAGLSNGGMGASRLAPRMRGSFVGLVLVSGVASDAGPPGIPTLVLHGRKDAMTGFGDATRYASRTGAKLVALDAAHFAMLVRSAESDAALRAFVGSVLGKTHAMHDERRPPAARLPI